MADNVAITAGSGTTVATDDVSSVHYQKVKLVDGTADSSTAIPGNADGLYSQGSVAHDAAVSGNPVIQGGRASSATPTAVSADGDAVRAWFDRSGRAIIASRCETPDQTSVAASATSTSLLAANSARLGATIFNDSSAILYLKLGATASTSSFTTKINPGGYYEVPYGYAGAIDGIWDTATGNARITELE